MSEILIQVEGVSHRFPAPGSRRGETQVLSEVDFTLRKGESLGIVGPSGVGKTTLGRIAAGILSPSSGTVRYHGVALHELRGRQRRTFRRKVQMLFQDPEGALNPARRAARSLEEVARLSGLRGEEVTQRVGEMLSTVHLSPEVLSRVPSRLSGGQNQRVALARVLMLEPEVIVLDEPTSALDVSVQAGMLQLLRELRATHALSYLLISHDTEVVGFMCDRVIELSPQVRCPAPPGRTPL